jgi:hypothetical protein
MENHEDPLLDYFQHPLISMTNASFIVFLRSPSFRKSQDEIPFKGGRAITSCISETLIKVLNK